MRLQLAMLGHADDVPGVPVGVTYRAADAELQVGGDWYDVIDVAAGRAALVVGDAVGHTLNATIAMGQLRSAIRATALYSQDPADLLRHADVIAGQTDGAECCTVAYAVLDLASGGLTYASAGHPPILILRAGGTAEYLAGGRGLPLGIASATRTSDVCQLTPGDLMVMYTDGLYERRNKDSDERLARLADLAIRLRDLPPTELSVALTESMLGGAVPQDDICVLVAAPVIGRSPRPADTRDKA